MCGWLSPSTAHGYKADFAFVFHLHTERSNQALVLPPWAAGEEGWLWLVKQQNQSNADIHYKVHKRCIKLCSS